MKQQGLLSPVIDCQNLATCLTPLPVSTILRRTNWEVCVQNGMTLRQNKTQLDYT